jgi:hypothetical protein
MSIAIFKNKKRFISRSSGFTGDLSNEALKREAKAEK